MKSSQIKFICIFSILIAVMLNLKDPKTSKMEANLVDAVVECQTKIKNSESYNTVDFDNAFKHKGTKVILSEKRFQVTGKVTIGRIIKPYGCLVTYNNNYNVEVIL